MSAPNTIERAKTSPQFQDFLPETVEPTEPADKTLERHNTIFQTTISQLWTELGGRPEVMLNDALELVDSAIIIDLGDQLDEILSGDAVSFQIANELVEEGDTESAITAIYGSGENVKATLEKHEINPENPQRTNINKIDLEQFSAELLTAATRDILSQYTPVGEARLDVPSLTYAFRDAKERGDITGKDKRENFILSLELTRQMSELVSNLILNKKQLAQRERDSNG